MGNAMKMLMLAQGNRRQERPYEEPSRNGYDMESRRNDYQREDRRNEYGGENRRNGYEMNENRYPRYDEDMENRRNEGGRSAYGNENAEMRRRRDKRGRYMEGESYSGLYDNGEIGFGNSRSYSAMAAGKESGKQSAQIGGSLWMKPTEEDEEHKLTKEKMHKWVKEMRDDKDKPLEPWAEDEVKPLARRFGYPINGEEFENFYTAIHMMKSDYCSVAEEFDVDTPAFYAALADAWLSDPDAAVQDREKLEAYYKYIVKGKK